MSEWSPEDYASVDRVSRELHARGWRKAFSLNEMLQAYESIVSQVEEGYDETVYEYLNDLACRRWLALAWPLVTETSGRAGQRICAALMTGSGRQLLMTGAVRWAASARLRTGPSGGGAAGQSRPGAISLLTWLRMTDGASPPSLMLERVCPAIGGRTKAAQIGSL